MLALVNGLMRVIVSISKVVHVLHLFDLMLFSGTDSHELYLKPCAVCLQCQV